MNAPKDPADLARRPDAAAILAAALGAAPAPRADQATEERETKHLNHPEATMNGPSVNEVDTRRDVPPPGDDDAPWEADGDAWPGDAPHLAPVDSAILRAPEPLFTGPPNRGILAADPPPFPVGALPDWLAAWVRAASDATATSLDVAAHVSLGVASWAAAWAPRATPMRVSWGPMTAPLVLYTCAVEDSATNKTGIFAAAAAPLRELEREIIADGAPDRDAMAAAHADASGRVAALKAALAEAHKTKAKGKTLRGDPPEVIAEALGDALRELAEAPAPVTPDVIVDDATPEALVRSLASVPVACVATSEGHEIFELALGRYGKGANFGALLKAHDGTEPIKVRRILREGDVVEHPLMSIAMLTQPITLRRIGDMPGDPSERGLIGRILWAWPQSVLGTRSPPSMSRPIPADIRNAYHAGIRTLYAAAPVVGADGQTVPIALDATATARADRYFNATEARLREGGDLRSCSSMAGKTHGQLLRIAGILHLADGHAPSDAIGAEVMTRALRVVKYYLATGLRVWRVMREGDEPRAAKVWRILRTRATQIPEAEIVLAESQNRDSAILRGHSGMSERDVFEAVKGTVGDMDGLRSVVRELAAAGYVATVPRPHVGPGRPPGPWIVLNPEADR